MQLTYVHSNLNKYLNLLTKFYTRLRETQHLRTYGYLIAIRREINCTPYTCPVAQALSCIEVTENTSRKTTI